MAAKKAAGSRRARAATASRRGLHLLHVRREIARVHERAKAYRKTLPAAQRKALDARIKVITKLKVLADSCFVPPPIQPKEKPRGRGR